MNIKLICLLFIISVTSISCSQRHNNEANAIVNPKSNIKSTPKDNLVTDFKPLHEDGDINVAIEIPSGTLEKWEVDKETGHPQLEHIDGLPRVINYLGYPGNYGMIPQTLLPKEHGGDGDPLDVLVLGAPIARGEVIKCKLIGVLHLLDSGEQDDKLISVLPDSPLYDINSIEEMNETYAGMSEIIELWFVNYKGSDKMISQGFGDKSTALKILDASIKAYKTVHTTLSK